MTRRNWSRRRFIFATAGTLVIGSVRSFGIRGNRLHSLADIESTVGGRVGVFALDTYNGRQLAHRPDERFAMCSTFKWVLAAAILKRVDGVELSLDTRVSYGSRDLLEYAPVTQKHASEGFMTVGALAEAALVVSDNTAGNLLLAKVGGPAGLTEFVRSIGDRVTRFDRYEPALNSNDAGDDRDTTSPRAMVGLMHQILCGAVLSTASRGRLLGWLRACETGKDRLRAGLPQGWIVGDKTGTGERGAANDVAIAMPPHRAPILVASYLSDASAGSSKLSAAHAEIGRLIRGEFDS